MEVVRTVIGFIYLASLAFSIPATLLIAQRLTTMPDQFPVKHPGGVLVIAFLVTGLLWNQKDPVFVNLAYSLANMLILSPIPFTIYCHRRSKDEDFQPPGDYGILKVLAALNSFVLLGIIVAYFLR